MKNMRHGKTKIELFHIIYKGKVRKVTEYGKKIDH